MYFGQHISSMHFIRILLLCLLLPINVLLGAVPSDTVEVDTLSVDKKALCAAAFDCLNCNRLDRARNYARQLLRLAERTDDRSYGQIYGHLILGLAGIESAPSTEVYMHLETARALAERYHDHEALMRVLNGFGNYSMFVNDDVYSAISYYFQALDEAKRVDDRRLYAMILSNISGAYLMRNDPSGLEYAREAIRIAREIEEPTPLFYATFNAAFYYLRAGDLEQAHEEGVAFVRSLWDDDQLCGHVCEADRDRCLYRLLLYFYGSGHGRIAAFFRQAGGSWKNNTGYQCRALCCDCQFLPAVVLCLFHTVGQDFVYGAVFWHILVVGYRLWYNVPCLQYAVCQSGSE